ncbi:MAG: 2-nitropropane dioxygenase [bacterium]|nr:2-nitropropane dioxygenase [bacterium]
MTWVSERNLVSAISNAGGFGVVASGAMPPEILAEEIDATRALTKKPFGVNLITLHPQLEEMAQVCLDKKVSHVVLAGGLPPTPIIQKLKEGGAKVICFAPALGLAKRLVRLGVDALVIEGQEAGGHIGPVSTSVLAQEILPHISQVPVFVAGGIARGEAVVSYLEMGASGCQLGTLFVCANECQAHPNFKKAFIRANARDAQISTQLDPRFPVIPVRGIVNDGSKKFLEAQREALDSFDKGELSQVEAQLQIEHFWAGALRRAVVDGDVETGSLMAGQSVGLVKKEQPTQEIIQELLDQALHVFEARQSADQNEGERQRA